METFCNQFLDFQFRQFGLFPPSIWCLVSLCLSVSPPPSRWTCCRSRDGHCWSAFRFTAAEKTVFRVELMVHLSLVSLSPSARPLGWRAHFGCWFYKKLKLRPGTPAPLFVEANYKGTGKPARDKTHLDVCPWPRCVCPSALLRAVPGQMARLLCQFRCSVQRIKAVVSISQNLSLVSLSPSARPWGWKQFKHIWFWRCFQSWRSYKELVPPYESLVCWHLFDQLLLFGCTWTQSPLIKMTSTNKMIKCHLSLVSESPSAAPGRSRWSRSLTPLCWTQEFVKLR